MDALPSSVSTFQIPIHHQPSSSSSSSRDFHHYFRAPTTHQTQLSSKSPQPSSISNRPTNFPSHNLHFNSSSSSSPHQLLSPSLKQFPTLVQHRAAAGYAAALVDVCRRNNTIEAAERDARRFGRLMRNEQIRAIMADPLMGDSEKGEVVKEIVEKGKFQRHVVALLKMMIQRGRLGMVGEVLGQFRDICKQLRGQAV